MMRRSSARVVRVTHIVSLGKDCRLTFQLQRYFNFGMAFPFDWWVTTPSGLLRVLDPPADPYEPSQLVERRKDGVIAQIVAADSSILFRHDFPRDLSRPDFPVVEDWRSSLGRARDRFIRRRERLLGLDRPSNQILFVRHGPDTADEQDALVAAFKKRFTVAQIRFLFINPIGTASDPAAMSLRFDESEGPDWRGMRAEWDAALGSVGIEIDNPEMPPHRHNNDIIELTRQIAEPAGKGWLAKLLRKD